MFISLCNFLGIPIATDKTFGPSTTLTFAGIELDSLRCQARLPRDKITKCIQFIANFLNLKKVMLRELQSLLGLLNFACVVVTPGHAFLRRLIDLTHGISHPHFFRRATSKTIFAYGRNLYALLMENPYFWMITGATVINFVYLRTHLAPLVLVPYSALVSVPYSNI